MMVGATFFADKITNISEGFEAKEVIECEGHGSQKLFLTSNLSDVTNMENNVQLDSCGRNQEKSS